MSTVVVVDYGMGNLRSVAKAIEHVAPEAAVRVSSDAAEIAAADRVVVPGQGAMPDCMRELAGRGLREAVVAPPRKSLSRHLRRPADAVRIMPRRATSWAWKSCRAACPISRCGMKAPDGSRLKVPHMGWNRVHQAEAHPLWQGIADDTRFYFVHSYYVEPRDPGLIAPSTHYGIPFTSAVARDNIFAVQFHPEKSAQAALPCWATSCAGIPDTLPPRHPVLHTFPCC
jgi:glutamine amidotransferase